MWNLAYDIQQAGGKFSGGISDAIASRGGILLSLYNDSHAFPSYASQGVHFTLGQEAEQSREACCLYPTRYRERETTSPPKLARYLDLPSHRLNPRFGDR